MYLELNSLTLERNAQVLFGDLSLVAHPRDTLVVLGPNGSGKTSLLLCLEGKLKPLSGQVVMPSKLLTGVLAQIPTDSSKAVFEVLRELTPPQILDEAIYDALITVGLVELSWSPVNQLSYGQRSRVYLSQLTLPYELLLVDEPTNHLDEAGVELLIELLRQSQAVKVVVTHHQQLATSVATSILELSGGSAKYYQMSFEEYRQAKADAVALLKLRADEAKSKAKALTESIRAKKIQSQAIHQKSTHFYYRAKAATLDRQSTIYTRRAERLLDEIEKPDSEKSVRFPPLSHKPYGGVLGYLPTRQGLHSITGTSRIWLRGANGSGKSTALVTLAKELARDGHAVGYLAQALTIEDMLVREWLLGVDSAELPTHLARLQLSHQLGNRSTASLSPGVLQKLSIISLTERPCSILLLDEPTNHLDIGTQQALASLLSKWPGALVLVCHDSGFVESARTTTSLWIGSGHQGGKDQIPLERSP